MNALIRRKVASASGFYIPSISAFGVCSQNNNVNNIMRPYHLRGGNMPRNPPLPTTVPLGGASSAAAGWNGPPNNNRGGAKEGRRSWRKRYRKSGSHKSGNKSKGGSGARGWKLWLKPQFWTQESGAILVLLASLTVNVVQFIQREVPKALEDIRERWDKYEKSREEMEEDIQERLLKYEKSRQEKKREDEIFKVEMKKSMEELNGKMDHVIQHLEKRSSWWLWGWWNRGKANKAQDSGR